MKDLVVHSSTNACWKQIGVWGDEHPRCPELDRVVHCRNCEVFTKAGRNLLEKELPDDYKYDWTQILSERKEIELPGTISVVIFRIREEWLSLPTENFQEIIDTGLLHRVPHRRNKTLLGVINVRGEIQLCVSLKHLLGLDAEDEEESDGTSENTQMMIINKDGNQWVFSVDEIYGVHHLHDAAFQNVPVTVIKGNSTFTKTIFEWEKRQVSLLDIDLLIQGLSREVQ